MFDNKLQATFIAFWLVILKSNKYQHFNAFITISSTQEIKKKIEVNLQWFQLHKQQQPTSSKERERYFLIIIFFNTKRDLKFPINYLYHLVEEVLRIEKTFKRNPIVLNFQI